jgi:2,5-furandicarboxylate decarboxylase 1
MALGHDFSSPFTHEAFDALLEKAKANPVDPAIVSGGPVKQVIKTGAEVNLQALPVPTFFELDSGPFITAAVGISRDPETGVQNIGVYRTLITGRNEFVINASSLSDLRVIYKKWEALGETMPIALAIGVDPAMLTAAACKLPPSVSEYGIAGALQGKPMELVQCETSDLTVPATAEFIIEGSVDFSRRVENLLGEFAGQYGPENAPITTVNAITHRSDAIFYTIMAGRNPEHNTLGNVAIYGVQRSITSALRAAIPEIKDLHVFMDPGMGTLAHVAISIDKTSDAQPKEIIEKTFQTGGHIFPVSMITKRVIIVDEDIDVKNFADVQWAIWNRAATERKFIVIPDVQSWELERAAKEGMKSVRIGIDATMDLEDVEKLVRPVTPGADKIRLEDYVDESRENAA